MRTLILQKQEVLQGYDAVSQLYPYVPPLSHWRAWEYAAYQKYELTGHVLDLGCGDGKYFELLWPRADQVTGVDISPVAVELAKRSGVYQNIHLTYAHQIPEPNAIFDHVFANCSLEHMDCIDEVLAEVNRCLKPGGTLLCSVVTDRYEQWALLPNLVSMAGFSNASQVLRQDFSTYHHLSNPFHPDKWQQHFINAGLIPEEHIPILPKHNSGFFLLMDGIWHVKSKDVGEIGDSIFPFLSSNPNFPAAFRSFLEGLLEMELDWQDCSGAVFMARKER
ncbi:class I SAM-dependent methyltransferase [Nodosilinea sp. FACHB-13]|uniref:class I SAM-dependent methyltransferase n=1 Tax=Cyanophyceae TaxID=3028117 RepID=UPI001681E617|nr:class I SAM-dependent methyltransferase [Nodosilinea sp. FACHB-13]MBD2109756.1 class I SAM-dependent methyltransferase [Nodosilinea sp. FACHB-13]